MSFFVSARISGIGCIFVGFDYILYKPVSYDVRSVEIYAFDAVNVFQYPYGVLQSAAYSSRQVYLGDISGYDHFGIEAEPCQEHFHLLRGSILCFIEDDKAVIKGTASHICEGSDFDIAALNIFLIGLRAEHIEQCIVKRAQIRVDLALVTAIATAR